MKLIVHIGQGKTGSSSIQATLVNSEEALTKNKVKYVGLNFEHSDIKKYDWQYAGLWGRLLLKPQEQAQAELLDVIYGTIELEKKKGTEVIIWSNESLFASHAMLGEVFSSLKEQKGLEVRGLVYLRKHEKWAQSAYQQWGIKHKAYKGEVIPFRFWAEKNFTLEQTLRVWCNFGLDTLDVRNFDGVKDLINDFFSAIELKDVDYTEKSSNESPASVALNMWALFNSQSEDPILPYSLEPLLDAAGVTNKKYKDVDLGSLFPDRESLNKIQSDNENDTKYINELFTQNSQPNFCSEAGKFKVKDYSVSTEQLIAGLLDICKHNFDEIQMLKKQIQKLTQG